MVCSQGDEDDEEGDEAQHAPAKVRRKNRALRASPRLTRAWFMMRTRMCVCACLDRLRFGIRRGCNPTRATRWPSSSSRACLHAACKQALHA
jgi:hypothetical protein